MRKFIISLIALAGVLFGCQQVDILEPVEDDVQPMKVVSLTTEFDAGDTKASLDSKTGEFKWQNGDVISVLATDGIFYDFTLASGAGQTEAVFKGKIPQTTCITTVATYPSLVPNGTANNILTNSTLNYTLPSEWTWSEGETNVPMVATFEADARKVAFRQVGAVMRFPVRNLPANSSFVLTMNDQTITGQFPVNVAELGQTAMVAGTGASTVTIKYTSTEDADLAVMNVPVPAGVYTDFNVSILDAVGNVIFTKDYFKNYPIQRSVLANMGQIVVTKTPADDGMGSEPDDTNYDAFGLGKMPISYWYTIPDYAHNYDDAKTRELYADMAATGINVVIHYGEVNCSIEENKRIMNIAEDLGMKYIGHVWGATREERYALIKEHLVSSPTYIGEYFGDEPSAQVFDQLGEDIKHYLTEFPGEEAYLNLFPIYTDPKKLGTASENRNQMQAYEEHINQYLNKVPTKTLSYDYYGLLKSGALGGDFYTNLDLVRSKTLARRMPYWVITQAGLVPTINRMPTEKEQRWTVWATLAGGSKGISYFCYWTPNDFEDYMIRRDGTKTDMYYWIQKLNSDIQTIGNKLMYCHADGLILTAPKYYPLYDNNGAGRTHYGPIKKVSGSTSIACGCFRDARVAENGDNFKGYKALVVSQMPTRNADAYLTIDSSVSKISITHINTTQTVELTNTLNTKVGDIAVQFDGAKLTLSIPEGEAAFLEF